MAVRLVLGLLLFLIAGGQIIGWPFREFPDWDQTVLRIPFIIEHRSAITHSCLLVALVSRIPQYGRAMAWGAALGLAVHLFDDMFPASWHGMSFIYFPVIGRLTWIPLDGNLIPTVLSFLWLGANMLAGIYIAMSVTVDEGT